MTVQKLAKGKVSVIMPCYNCEKTVWDALKSLEAQTYKNFEVIAVNDGSSDHTGELLQKAKETLHIQMLVIEQENKGVSAARNRGLAEADGEYVAFLDSDDEMHKDFLDMLAKPMNQYDVDTCYGYLSRKRSDLGRPAGNIQFVGETGLWQASMFEMEHLGFYTFVYRNEILKKHGILFREDLKTGEDREFLWSYLARAKSALQTGIILYWYRPTPGSAVSRVSWERTASYQTIERIYKLLCQQGGPYRSIAERYLPYMGARYLWSYAKTFCAGGRKDLFKKLCEEYPVKEGMETLKDCCPDRRVRITAALFLINRNAFYLAVRLVTFKRTGRK